MLLDNRTADKHRIYQAGVRVGRRSSRRNGRTEVVAFPVLRLGEHSVTDVPLDLQVSGSNPYPVEFLGSDLLGRKRHVPPLRLALPGATEAGVLLPRPEVDIRRGVSGQAQPRPSESTPAQFGT